MNFSRKNTSTSRSCDYAPLYISSGPSWTDQKSTTSSFRPPDNYLPARCPERTAAFNCESIPANLLFTCSFDLFLHAQPASVTTPLCTVPSLLTSSRPPITLTSPQGFGIHAIYLKYPFSSIECAQSSRVMSSYLQARPLLHIQGKVGERIVRMH